MAGHERRRIVLAGCAIALTCSVCMIGREDVGRAELAEMDSIRAMQLAVMARRAAVTGQRASAGLLPVAPFQPTTAPMQAVAYSYTPQTLSNTGPFMQQYARQAPPQETAAVSLGSALSKESKSAHLALSGALAAFHGAALPQASATVDTPASTGHLNARDKLFNIFTAPSSSFGTRTQPKDPRAMIRAGGSTSPHAISASKSRLQAFHDRLFQLFTSPEGQQKPQPSLPLATVDNVISTDLDPPSRQTSLPSDKAASAGDSILQSDRSKLSEVREGGRDCLTRLTALGCPAEEVS